ncbi:MAG: hypothetical protein KAJ39_01255, partial [Gammaproteobacteria bacterium]|nr:hypothetical protein [Gammaproteobacteria bacterium]
MTGQDSAELINALQFYITKAFDNEALFLHRFTNFDEVKNIELDECYMARRLSLQLGRMILLTSVMLYSVINRVKPR